MNHPEKKLENHFDELWSLTSGGIAAPKGFQAAGIKANLKQSENSDLALLVVPKGTICSGVFTQSMMKANCIELCQERLKARNGLIRAVLINSGQANACTGEQGIQDNLKITNALSQKLGLSNKEILICSTGVIGVRIPTGNLLRHLDKLIMSLNEICGKDAAKAIMTTDLKEKEISIEANLGNRRVRIGGMAKGSGMIHPNMATMLAYLTCDVKIPKVIWDEIIKDSAQKSFNAITVDGDTSTNDTFLGFCTGEPLEASHIEALKYGVDKVTNYLAKEIARDGEGATSLIEVNVEGCANDDEARLVGRKVCSSSLVKTAIHGCDPNWGRIISAIGNSGVAINPKEVNLWVGEFLILKDGLPVDFDKSACVQYMKETRKNIDVSHNKIGIKIRIGNGIGKGSAWGCDLSKDYITINADYTT